MWEGMKGRGSNQDKRYFVHPYLNHPPIEGGYIGRNSNVFGWILIWA